MPKLVRMYLINVATGFGIAAMFLAAMLWTDVAGLGRLVTQSPQGWIAGLMIFMGSGTLFAGVQFAIRIMAMAEDEPRGPRGGLRQQLVPIPVRRDEQRRPVARRPL
ncbi:hypothetical protein ACFOHK_09395 [Falsigemmobacter intermedius]|uniref:Uncharacterized protein n=1 Tax=Falsigemmobacter intermedius TaxID=1553448 RepID=A0A3S3WMX9_9RHOB|nr:hypothetical protein [Falsigemmobacter intermedius]RWY41068.1 hypothetical protein EP867_10150 [Falsigemmobacter intermedius]